MFSAAVSELPDQAWFAHDVVTSNGRATGGRGKRVVSILISVLLPVWTKITPLATSSVAWSTARPEGPSERGDADQEKSDSP